MSSQLNTSKWFRFVSLTTSWMTRMSTNAERNGFLRVKSDARILLARIKYLVSGRCGKMKPKNELCAAALIAIDGEWNAPQTNAPCTVFSFSGCFPAGWLALPFCHSHRLPYRTHRPLHVPYFIINTRYYLAGCKWTFPIIHFYMQLFANCNGHKRK